MTSTFVSRAEWGAAPRRGSTSLSASAVTVHWAGTPARISSHSQCAGVVRSYQSYHMNTHGWVDIAYNLLVCPHGYIFEGRGNGRRSAANGTNDGNGSSFAICYINGTGEPFTDEAKVAINDAAAILVPDDGREWYSHRDWLNTGCPGDEIAEWVGAGHPAGNVTPEPEPEPEPVPCDQQTFELGDSHYPCVVQIQNLLNARGFGLVNDGDFGPKTEAAVKTFQRNHRLTADGVVGPRTWKSLFWGQK